MDFRQHPATPIRPRGKKPAAVSPGGLAPVVAAIPATPGSCRPASPSPRAGGSLANRRPWYWSQPKSPLASSWYCSTQCRRCAYSTIASNGGTERVIGTHPERLIGTHLGLQDSRSGQERQPWYLQSFDFLARIDSRNR